MVEGGKYSELEKVAQTWSKAQIIGEFLEWLEEEKSYFICEPGARSCDGQDIGGFNPVIKSTDDWIAEFFGIDMNKVEKERRQLLKEHREFVREYEGRRQSGKRETDETATEEVHRDQGCDDSAGDGSSGKIS